MAEKFGTYLVEYNLDGETWLIDVKASSQEDAMRRLGRAASFGTVLNPSGEAFSIPAVLGWWVPAWCWVQNLFVKPRS